jgi:hypothetical protein
MFQYYDINQRCYINFDNTTNELLQNSKDLLIYRCEGDTKYLFDLSGMKQIDITNNISKRIRKI